MEAEIGGDEDGLSSEQLDAMFGDDDEPEPIEGLMDGEGDGIDDGDDILDPEQLPEPDPIPGVFMEDDEDDEDEPKERSIGKIIGIAAAVLIVGLIGAAFALKSMVIEMIPASAALYDMIPFGGESIGDGLEIGQVKSARETEGGIEVLIVRGIITNISDEKRQVPMISVALFDGDDNRVQHIVTAPLSNQLAAGENVGFKARLMEPSPLARRLAVSFSDPETDGEASQQ